MLDADVRRYFDKGWPTDRTGTDRFLAEAMDRNQRDVAAEWVIADKADGGSSGGGAIGRIWFGPLFSWCRALNVGYSLDRRHWGKGIAAEALRRVIQFGFEQMNLARIEAWHDTDNAASGQVMTKCGMRFEGTLRQRSSLGDAHMYSVIRHDHDQRVVR
jgi:ribosomal-protein-alanine N-acetyltransferase